VVKYLICVRRSLRNLLRSIEPVKVPVHDQRVLTRAISIENNIRAAFLKVDVRETSYR
jgi:hypothetical protein